MNDANTVLIADEWVMHARPAQYPLGEKPETWPETWLVLGGRGAGKTRLGAEWVNGLVRGFPPFADRPHGLIALVGETLGDVREVMIDGPSGIATIARHDRPRFEASRRRLVWASGAVAQIFSSEDPESLRGPQFEAAWCDESTGFALRSTLTQPATVGTLLSALPADGFSGRFDNAAALTVELAGGALSSSDGARFLNGANSAAVRAENGVWEVVQFEDAEEISPDVWRLSRLLRGQLGTEDAMAAGATEGTDFVLLDTAVKPAGLRSGEAGLALNWRVGPSGYDLAGGTFASSAATGGLRARMPLSPVHLKPKAVGGDTLITWIRRGRIDADDWASTEIPLGEEREEYRVDIAPVGGVVVRSAMVTAPQFTYAAAAIATDFGTPPAEIDVTVRQLSLAVGWGVPATARLGLN